MGRLSIASPPCVADNFGGEIVALNLDTGYYFSLPGLAGAIWRDLVAGHATQDIITELATANPQLGVDAGRFIDTLVERGLMRKAPESGHPTSAPEFRGLVATGAKEIVFVPFDDMKDLVMTDPIHEVDEEAGWPVRPEDRG